MGYVLTPADREKIDIKVKEDIGRDNDNNKHENGNDAYTTQGEYDKAYQEYFDYYLDRLKRGLAIGGNNKNKPKIYKNKIILGKERGIYKIPGSRKDYIKYKGKFIAVKDFIKLKNKWNGLLCFLFLLFFHIIYINISNIRQGYGYRDFKCIWSVNGNPCVKYLKASNKHNKKDL